jgi:ankyrin repeat protein
MSKNNGEEVSVRLRYLCHTKNAPSAASVVQLLQEGANVNSKGMHGDTVLINAASRGHLVAVQTLVTTEGIDIDAKNIFGNTAFIFACRDGHLEVVKELLAAHRKKKKNLANSNFSINDKNTNGLTALMFSCIRSRVEIIKLLLSIPSINMYAMNNGGKTALDLVKGTASEGEIRTLFRCELLPSFSPAIDE